LTVVLLALGALQYQWIGQLSRAEHDRMLANLNNSVTQFRTQFSREMIRVCAAFQADGRTIERRDWSGYAGILESRLHTLTVHNLSAGVFIREGDSQAAAGLLRLNPQGQQFEPVSWPSRFDPLRELLGGGRAGTGRSPQEFRGFAWIMAFSVPALIQPLLEPVPGDQRGPREMRVIGHLIVELDLQVLLREYLPDLAYRCFGGPEDFLYQVAVLRGSSSGDWLYLTDPNAAPRSFDSSEVRVNLLMGPRELIRTSIPEERMAAPARQQGGPQPPSPPGRQMAGGPRGMFRMPVLVPSDGPDQWTLAVKYKEGSIETLIGRLRRRNMFMGFGILLLLAASIGTLFVSAQKAAKLAKLQMDFVAGVSHELRTPLAVIHSAAENLADGVVPDASPRAREYGEMIRGECRRLSRMVEQVLQFSRGRSSQHPLRLRAVSLAQAIDAAVSGHRTSLQSAGFEVETKVEEGLDQVVADFEALVHCLENLISNAMKYSGAGRRIAIQALASPDSNGREIQIRVEDAGVGIDSKDLPHIFDAFYRGEAAVSGQIAGSGLGLSIVRDLMQAMGGAATVQTKSGAGSVFTLHLPVRPASVLE
jgi:signal transduction histidine kinase